jgi:hypothetical protein
MSDNNEQKSEKSEVPDHNEMESFSRVAEEQTPGIINEFIDFLLYNKKWWMAPIIVVLLLVGVVVIAAGSGAAPFIYTLF